VVVCRRGAGPFEVGALIDPGASGGAARELFHLA
jgi:hypothetical protein